MLRCYWDTTSSDVSETIVTRQFRGSVVSIKRPDPNILYHVSSAQAVRSSAKLNITCVSKHESMRKSKALGLRISQIKTQGADRHVTEEPK